VKKEWYQSPTPVHAITDITVESATVFMKLDAMKGYHQRPLDEENQTLSTFIPPFGWFKFLWAPYGKVSNLSYGKNRTHLVPYPS